MTKKDSKKRTSKMAALSYCDGLDPSPRIVASGRGLLAEKLIDEAKKLEISIYQDPQLVDALVQLEVGEYIPPELFEAVAQVLAFIYYLDHQE